MISITGRTSKSLLRYSYSLTVHVEFGGSLVVPPRVHRRVVLRHGGPVGHRRTRAGAPPSVDLPHGGQFAVGRVQVVVRVPLSVRRRPVLVYRVEDDVRGGPRQGLPLPYGFLVDPLGRSMEE